MLMQIVAVRRRPRAAQKPVSELSLKPNSALHPGADGWAFTSQDQLSESQLTMRTNLPVWALALFLTVTSQLSTQAQGNSFTYQGRLNSLTGPASGQYDLKFTLYDSVSNGNVVAIPLTNVATAVSNGLFAVALDFGTGVFNGASRWLEIAVRTNGGGGFATLTPRQALTPSPYALYAPSAGTAKSAGSVAAADITGTLPDLRLSPNVTLLSSSPQFAGEVQAPAMRSADKVYWAASQLSSDQGGSIELGSSLLTNTVPFIDFHYGVASDEDFNIRLINHEAGVLEIWSPPYTPLLRIQQDGNIVVDPINRNIDGVLTPGLTFGGGSGEGIASSRSGSNQWGLNFFTSFEPRLCIDHNGWVSIGKPNPTSMLDVNGAVTAANFIGSGAGLTNVNLGNGSVTLANLGPDVQFARAPYLTSVTSSPPQQLTWKISIDGVVTDPPASLGGPYVERYAVVDYWNDVNHNSGYQPRPGLFTPGELKLRRRVTEDQTWLNYRLSWYTNQALAFHSIRIELMQGTVNMARWTFPRGVATQHNYRLAVDGLPVEEITFTIETNAVRQLDPIGGSLPAGPGPQVGFASGQARMDVYGVQVDGRDWMGLTLVRSDVSESSDILLDASSGRITGLRNTKPSQLILRQSPFAPNDLWAWYRTVTAAGAPDRRWVDVYLGRLLLQHCGYAYPTSYTLAVGDDGQPYEDYSIVYVLGP